MYVLLRATCVLRLVLANSPLFGQTDQNARIVDCDRGESLRLTVKLAHPGDTIRVRGACDGPLTITQDQLAIQASGTASVNGKGQDAITINGAHGVNLTGLSITRGSNGILLQSNASAKLIGGEVTSNALNGIDLESTSSLIITGTYTVSNNGVFGINANNTSSLTLTAATLTVNNNTLGMQIGTGSGAFISDSHTALNVTGNLTTGLTIVSGAHMVAFGGAITSFGNGIHGISIDSKAGLDLDAAATVESSHNHGDGVHLEETSVLTMFNTPAFSGEPGFTTLNTHDNAGSGVNVETSSNVTLINQASITSTHNTKAGVAADDGSSITLINSQISDNPTDIALSFGARATLNGNTIGTITCDSTVLLRSSSGAACPTSVKTP